VEERQQLLKYFAVKCRLSEESVVRVRESEPFQREQLSGAEVENLCREEVMSAARQTMMMMASS
jgi:SpoVK/Ycf46/Vps4 family AAA+-type ATPase